MKTGKIIRIVSNCYTIWVDGKNIECHARGKFRNEKITPLVGDICKIDLENKYIMEILPRKNFLLRPSIANIEGALIVTSCKEPEYSPYLLDKLISLIEINQMEPILFFSKIDLLNEKEKLNFQKIQDYYKSIGYQVYTLKDQKKLKEYLTGKTIVITGQTGAGKSTLLNHLDKSLDLKTSPISKALNRGVHTTRHTELYKIGNFLIADTPGFSSLDLAQYQKEEIRNSFVEFQNYNCRFKDCNHLKEIDCAVKKAVEEGKIEETRYKSYQSFMEEKK